MLPKEQQGFEQYGEPKTRALLRAPPGPAASNRPCQLGTPCTGSLSACARRCSPSRTPCTCSLSALLSDARPSARLALAPSPLVLADAKLAALIAQAPLPVVLALAAAANGKIASGPAFSHAISLPLLLLPPFPASDLPARAHLPLRSCLASRLTTPVVKKMQKDREHRG